MSSLEVQNLTDGTDSVPTGYVVNGSAKAWSRVNGVSTTTITSSMNVSSVTDVDVGGTVVNLTSNMVDGLYSAASSIGDGTGAFNRIAVFGYNTAPSVSAFGTKSALASSGSADDSSMVSFSIKGDLA